MTDFKLLAIRPLAGCSKRFSKVLKPGKLYKLYNNYVFDGLDDQGNGEVTGVTLKSEGPTTLYEIKSASDPICINISAIVGKNGSGKSALMELFFAAVYLLALERGLLKKPNKQEQMEELISFKNQLKVEVYYQLDNCIYCLQFGKHDDVSFFPILFKKDESDIAISRDRAISFILEQGAQFEFSKFFYSISINYSIYGLNSLHTGSWIDTLFHKNDGYQTPLVITPMRDEGNFDINTEEDLAKYRLLANILRTHDSGYKKHRELTESQEVRTIKFTLNKDKVKYAYVSEDGGRHISFDQVSEKGGIDIREKDEEYGRLNDSIKKKIYEILLGETKPLDQINSKYGNVLFKEEVEKYIVKKIIQIADTYSEYSGEIEFEPLKITVAKKEELVGYAIKFKDLGGFLTRLGKDNTHITFKLKQAINYLKNDILSEEPETNVAWIKETYEEMNDFLGKLVTVEVYYLEIGVELLANRIDNKNIKDFDVIELIPPSLFDPEIELVNIVQNGDGSIPKESSLVKNENFEEANRSYFRDLSSGEQQFIHAVQSILYHLNNIESVFNQPDESSIYKRKIEYECVNLLFDEVELYFHPDYQRKFIASLLSGIENLYLKKIKGINLLFSTHSPFILSDILASNTLKLIKGEPRPYKLMEQTFGANIHDLLANDFFMEEGFMGEWAKEKIKKAIKYLDYIIEHQKEPDNSEWSGVSIQRFINIIGEPLIKNSLQDMFHAAFPKSTVQSQINSEE
jgi:hypothetical protein